MANFKKSLIANICGEAFANSLSKAWPYITALIPSGALGWVGKVVENHSMTTSIIFGLVAFTCFTLLIKSFWKSRLEAEDFALHIQFYDGDKKPVEQLGRHVKNWCIAGAEIKGLDIRTKERKRDEFHVLNVQFDASFRYAQAILESTDMKLPKYEAHMQADTNVCFSIHGVIPQGVVRVVLRGRNSGDR